MALLVAGGVVIFWPALTTPFFLDDYLQMAMVSGTFPAKRGALDLYDFVADDDRQALFDRGFLPWWGDPRLSLRFLRPLSSAMLFAEHRWLGAWPWAMHLCSFVWWVLTVFAARAFFRACIRPRAAAFATYIFALAPCHSLPIGWLANCEALMALAFGALGLTAVRRWQDGGRHVWLATAVLGFSLSLLSGEYALGCGAFALALAWKGTTRGRRWGSVLVFAIPASAYLVARSALGYGADASGFYQDPMHDTWLFLEHAPWRASVLVLAGWFSQDSTAWRWEDQDWPVVAVVLVLLYWGRATLRQTARELPAADARMLWTLTAASFGALLPVLAVSPSVRLVGVAMLGIAPAVAVILDVAWFGREFEAREGPPEWAAIAAMLLGFAHLFHGPGRAWANARQIKTYAVEFGEHVTELAKRLEGKEAPEVVVVRGLDDIFFYGFALERLGIHGTRWIVLSHTGHVLCRRDDMASLELLVAADAALYPAMQGDLYRSEQSNLRRGESFATGELVANVLEMDPQGPRRARFVFPADLDDPRWTWVGESRRRGFYDATPPKVGFGAPFDP